MICDVLSDINKCGFREWAQKYGDREEPQARGSSESAGRNPPVRSDYAPFLLGKSAVILYAAPFLLEKYAVIRNSALFLLSNTPKSRILPCFFRETRPNREFRPVSSEKHAQIENYSAFLPRNTPKSRIPACFFRATRPNPKIQPVFTEETHPNPKVRPTRLLLPRNGKDG